jgi:tyrosinase
MLIVIDPIFFLHHAQIDRLWWTWQTRDLKARAVAYNGPSSHGSSAAAQLNDLIEMVAIAPRVLVRSVMVIDNELLCYRYDS